MTRALLLGLLVAACATPPPTTGVVEGRVRYEDRVFDRTGFTGEIVPMPARGVRVALFEDTTLLAETQTDDEGRFSLPYTVAEGSLVSVRAFAEARLGDQELQTVDSMRDVHWIESGPSSIDTIGEVELLAGVDDGSGGAFNIIDVVYTGFAFLAPHLDAAGPPLTLHWEAEQELATRYSEGNIYIGGQLADTDEYDDDIILHELGHYVARTFVPDHAGGGSMHRDRRVSPELAYGEGAPYFFAAMVQGRAWYIDTFVDDVRLIDLEALTQNGVSEPDLMGTSTGGFCGDLREELVAAILWDAFDADSPGDPSDTVDIGADGYMQIFLDYFGTWPHEDQGAPGPELADFLHALETELGVPAAAVQQLADERGFPTMVDDCSP